MKNITFNMKMNHTFWLIFVFKCIIVSSNPISPPDCTSRVGNCEDLNELCEFIPLSHILCEQDKIKQECPRLCNNCPVVATFLSEQSAERNLVDMNFTTLLNRLKTLKLTEPETQIFENFQRRTIRKNAVLSAESNLVGKHFITFLGSLKKLNS